MQEITLAAEIARTYHEKYYEAHQGTIASWMASIRTAAANMGNREATVSAADHYEYHTLKMLFEQKGYTVGEPRRGLGGAISAEISW